MTFAPHFEMLPPAQKALWPELSAVRAFGFVLYGGTAIALRLGHRTSIDFDFFTGAHIDPDHLRREFGFLKDAVTLQTDVDTLTVVASAPLHGEVKLSFFGGLSFVDAVASSRTADGVLDVASLDDLMATKLVVLQKRVEAKDYMDIAAMVRAGVSVTRGLSRARRMYGVSFQPSETLKAMTYFNGGDLAVLTELDRLTLIQAAGSAVPE
jgi:hypothetical protein